MALIAGGELRSARYGQRYRRHPPSSCFRVEQDRRRKRPQFSAPARMAYGWENSPDAAGAVARWRNSCSCKKRALGLNPGTAFATRRVHFLLKVSDALLTGQMATTSGPCASFSRPDRLLLGRGRPPLLDFPRLYSLDEVLDVDQTFVIAGLLARVPIRLHPAWAPPFASGSYASPICSLRSADISDA